MKHREIFNIGGQSIDSLAKKKAEFSGHTYQIDETKAPIEIKLRSSNGVLYTTDYVINPSQLDARIHDLELIGYRKYTE